MKTIGPPSIVVGVEESTAGEAALDWAVREATRRHLPLHLLRARHSEMLLGAEGGYGSVAVDLMAEGAEAARHLLLASAERARASSPSLTITVEISSEPPAAALVGHSVRADTVVLGSHGAAPLVNALLGSVSTQVAAHAGCPVVVVRERPHADQKPHGVVVGVDGSPAAQLALGYAFEAASFRGCRLDVVHVWWTRLAKGLTEGLLQDQLTQQELALSESMVGWSEKYPDVAVHRHLRIGTPVPILVAQARDAELLVVGSRGLGGFRRLLLGSVSHGVLQHATCPVAVVRPSSLEPGEG